MSYIQKILIVVALLGLVFCGIFTYNITQSFSGSNTVFDNAEAYVYIPTKADANTLETELFPLLKDAEAFVKIAKRLGYTKMKAGKYTIKKGMSNLEIVRTLQAKSDLIDVVISDNKDVSMLAKQISNHIEADENNLVVFMNDSIFMNENRVTLETLYKPGTYKMPWNTSAKVFREQMYEFYQNRNKQ